MLKKIIINTFFGAAAAITAVIGGLTANATTVDDVMAEARKWGYPESTIQDAYNYYLQDPDSYDSDDFDLAIEKLRSAGGNLITTGPQKTNNTTTTTAVQTTAAAPSTDKNDSTVTTTAGSEPAPEQQETDIITLTMPDGSTFTRISKKDFIKLSYKEKMDYISTFTPQQQQIIIDNLSPEEYRSLLKQLPSDQKMEVIEDLSGAVEAMGMNLTVEELTDDSLSVAMRDDDGVLIGVSNAGSLVEDTGYDRRSIFAAAGVLFFIAAAAALIVIRRSFRNDQTGDNNE
ncbi:MAG: hypothetical protein GXY08_14775 [Ruminococcus sp.]|nr:hypothetical protein [Ruminococcus sp.]